MWCWLQCKKAGYIPGVALSLGPGLESELACLKVGTGER